MARVNVYLPDALARDARDAGVNISKVTQEALGEALLQGATDRWLERLERSARVDIAHASVIRAIDAARAELGDS